MKIIGWILVSLAAFYLFGFFDLAIKGYDEPASTALFGVFLFGVIGLFLISQAKKKEKNKKDKENWKNNENKKV